MLFAHYYIYCAISLINTIFILDTFIYILFRYLQAFFAFYIFFILYIYFSFTNYVTFCHISYFGILRRFKRF